MTDNDALPHSDQSPGPGDSRRLPSASVVGWSMFAVGTILWAFSGFAWWVPVVGIGLLILLRLVMPLTPRSWRAWMGPALLITLLILLLTATSIWNWMVAAGLVGAVLGARKRRHWKPLAVAGVALLIGVIGTGWQEWQEHQRQQEMAWQRHETDLGKILPQSPPAVLQGLHNMLTRADATDACLLATPAARAQFATVHGAPSCENAVHKLASQVTDRSRYPDIDIDYDTTVENTGEHATVDGCSVYWSSALGGVQPDAGPKFGRLTVRRVGGGGWQITRYEPCGTGPTFPDSTSAAPDPNAPPPRSWDVPTDPTRYVSLLTRSIANSDGNLCDRLFSQAASAQFATAHGTSRCEAAISNLTHQVRNPVLYSRGPVSTIPAQQSGTRTILDACSVRWMSLDETTPGPPPGQLELEPRPDGPGYYIAGYRPC